MILFQLLWFITMASIHSFQPEDRISPLPVISNKYVVSIKDVPYHVLIVYNNLYCSGSLVSSMIVVTAASCLAVGDTRNVFVKVGASTIIDRGQTIPVQEVKLHEYFRYLSYMDNDIAMLVLKEHVTFRNKEKKVLLADHGVSLKEGTTIDVSGWGGNNLGSRYLNKLLLAHMVVLGSSECQQHYAIFLTRSNYCVQYQPDRRFSDNGGPAVFEGHLVGIVSYVPTNDTVPQIAILTNVSHFKRWIVKNGNRFLTKYCTGHEDIKIETEETIDQKDYDY